MDGAKKRRKQYLRDPAVPIPKRTLYDIRSLIPMESESSSSDESEISLSDDTDVYDSDRETSPGQEYISTIGYGGIVLNNVCKKKVA